MKNRYEVKGNVTAILLNRKDGTVLETLISTSDLEKVKKFPNTWCAAYDPKGETFYVFGFIKRKVYKLHRWILDTPKNMQVDHKNHNTLDNTRENIRNCKKWENGQNKKLQPNNKSGVRGVHWQESKKRWIAAMKIKGKRIHVGNFIDLKDAEKAMIEARLKYMSFSDGR